MTPTGKCFPLARKKSRDTLLTFGLFMNIPEKQSSREWKFLNVLTHLWNSFLERMTPAHKFLGRERVKKEEWSSRPLGQEARGSDPPICIGSHRVVDVRPPGHKGAGTEQILQLLWSQAPILVLQTHTQHPVQVTFTIYICTHSQCGWPSTHNQCEWPSTHNLWMTQHPQSVWMTQHPQSVWMTQHP